MRPMLASREGASAAARAQPARQFRLRSKVRQDDLGTSAARCAEAALVNNIGLHSSGGGVQRQKG